jgi:ribonuclease-3
LILNIYKGIFNNPEKNILKASKKDNFPYFGLLDNEKKLKLEKILNITINDVGVYEQALMHRSYVPILNRKDLITNERLEFFGDAVLGLLITEHLFLYHSAEVEGKLTKIRSWLVNKHSLAVCAGKLKLDEFIMLSYSAENALKDGSESIIADALEALIAAVYIDSGMETAREFVVNRLLSIMLNEKLLEDKNFKSRLLEAVQSEGKKAPTYSVIEESGPDHLKEFIIGAFVDGKLQGSGTGKSKKEAEQNAAKNAIENHFSLIKIE